MERSFFRMEKNVTYRTEKNGVPNPGKASFQSENWDLGFHNSLVQHDMCQNIYLQK